MPPSLDTIKLLNNNLKDLYRNGKLIDSLLLWEALTIRMNEAQFELAVTSLRMSTDNIEIARLFLVEGKTALQLSEEQGVSASRLSKILKRVSENYESQLSTLGLVRGEYMLDKKTAKLVRELEASKISEAKLKHYAVEKKQRKTRRKK